MTEQFEVGKLYKTFQGDLYECVGSFVERVDFRCLTAEGGGYSIFPNVGKLKIMREATSEDILDAEDAALASIDSLEDEIARHKTLLNDLVRRRRTSDV